MITTVDKFAQMPWNGSVQMLFGQVDGYCERHGFRSPHLAEASEELEIDGVHRAKGACRRHRFCLKIRCGPRISSFKTSCT